MFTTHTAWVTSTAYVVGNNVSSGGVNYNCLVSHTSGTFATDLLAGKWQLGNFIGAQMPAGLVSIGKDGVGGAQVAIAGANAATQIEGTWTPSFGGWTVTPTTWVSKYKKIGNVVYWWIEFTSTSTAAGGCYLTLPTTIANGGSFTAQNNITGIGTGYNNTSAAYPPAWTAQSNVRLTGFYFAT
jgi:hypothetical protein